MSRFIVNFHKYNKDYQVITNLTVV